MIFASQGFDLLLRESSTLNFFWLYPSYLKNALISYNNTSFTQYVTFALLREKDYLFVVQRHHLRAYTPCEIWLITFQQTASKVLKTNQTSK